MADQPDATPQPPNFTDLLSQDWLSPYLANILDAKDALCFAATCRLARVVCLGNALDGVDGSARWNNSSSAYAPHYWQSFQLPTRTHTALVHCKWHDQGWGNRKGMLSVVKRGGKAPNDYCKWSADVRCGAEPAPHDEAPLRLRFRPVDDEPLEYDLCARAGGGGGHSLSVKDLVVRPLVFVEGGTAPAAVVDVSAGGDDARSAEASSS